ncbi:hypothetical protein SVIOM342S_09535 [Streptomyces violaceorubidus]
MRERHASRNARRAREFEAFVAGAAGRLLHAATLLTAEVPDANPRARRLLALSLAHTYAYWDRLHGEDPYDRTRRYLATRFAREAWHRYGVLGRARRRAAGPLGRLPRRNAWSWCSGCWKASPRNRRRRCWACPWNGYGRSATVRRPPCCARRPHRPGR